MSTWNKDGDKHGKDCPFRVEYKGKIGRKKLIAHCKEMNPSDEAISRCILNKIKGIKRIYNGEEKNKIHTYSKKVDSTGEDDVIVSIDDNHDKYDGNISERRKNITSIDANYLTKAYVDLDKCVYGICNNVQIGQNNGAYYGYINLDNSKEKVAVHLPEAFYSQEDSINVEDFKKYLTYFKKK